MKGDVKAIDFKRLGGVEERQDSDRFMTILDEQYPTWREARAELNELPLSAETWKE